jgi:hypothetical protein
MGAPADLAPVFVQGLDALGGGRALDDPVPIGIAYEVGRIGGLDWDTGEPIGPREAVWRLVVGKDEVEGRFVLRAGRYVELAEDIL